MKLSNWFIKYLQPCRRFGMANSVTDWKKFSTIKFHSSEKKLSESRKKFTDSLPYEHSYESPLSENSTTMRTRSPLNPQAQVNELNSIPRRTIFDFLFKKKTRIPSTILSSLTLSCKLHLFAVPFYRLITREIFITDFKPFLWIYDATCRKLQLCRLSNSKKLLQWDASLQNTELRYLNISKRWRSTQSELFIVLSSFGFPLS